MSLVVRNNFLRLSLSPSLSLVSGEREVDLVNEDITTSVCVCVFVILKLIRRKFDALQV